MKAAILKAFGTPLVVETVPDPVLGTGEVIVDVVVTRVLAYANEVYSGQRQYLLELPAIPGPGAIGRVRAFGPDASHLGLGDWVYCDPTVRSRDDPVNPDITLQGLSARGPGGLTLQRHHRDGALAEQMRLPTENAVRLGAITAAQAEAMCGIGTFLVPYGGLLAGKLQAGENLLVSGATGSFGSAAVAVALAMGAGGVIATGRNTAALAELAKRFGPRVRTVAMAGDEASDRAAIQRAAPGAIDLVLDLLPPAATAVQSRTAIMAVRPYGRVVLMGGVGMLGGSGLDLPYPWIMRNCISIHGQWMYPPAATAGMVAMLRAGLIDLSHYTLTRFGLDDVNAAVAHAAAHAGPFSITVVRP